MKSYIYYTAAPARPGWFARTMTYHERAVDTKRYEAPKVREVAAPFIDPSVVMVDNNDGTLTIGRWTFPRRIRRREVIAAGRAGKRKDWQRLIIQCDCGRPPEVITLGAWRWCEAHGTEACRACQLGHGQSVKEWVFAKTG